MARQVIDTGSAVNQGDSDTIRGGFIKTEDNFIDLYSLGDPEGLFPATSSVSNPTQITGSNGSLAVLGVTGSIDIKDNLSGSSLQVDSFPGVFQAYGNIYRVQQAQLIAHKKISSFNLIGVKAESSADNGEKYSLTTGIDPFSGGSVVKFHGGINNRRFLIRGTGNTQIPPISRLMDGTGVGTKRIGINLFIENMASNMNFQVSTDISASNYLASSLPTSDPGVAGQWFTTSSQAIFGRFNFKILCVSPG
jgi:hypothetical protein